MYWTITYGIIPDVITPSLLEEILITALKGGEFAEIFIEETKITQITCEDNKIEKVISGVDHGYGLRVIDGRETKYTCGNALPIEPCQDKNPDKVPLEEKIHIVEVANATARSFGKAIQQVIVSYLDVNQNVIVANSEGVYAEDQRVRTRLVIQVVAAKDGILQTAHEAPGGLCGFELFEKYKPEDVASQAAKRALLMLEARPAPTGKMTVVLAGEAGGTMIHEACGHSLEADFILKGTSIFTGKIGTKVASDLITVIDDATLPQNYGSFRVDDEGTPAQETILIENGILKNYLSDRYTAKLLGITSSGNGRRESFRFKPVPRMTNTYIAAGKTDPQEIIDSVKEGLLIKRLGGGEVNVVNGDFVFEVTEGYLIENGKVKHPVRGAALIGNGPEVLKIIDMVGSDLTFMTGTCGKYDLAPVSDGQPTLRIPEIIIGGRI